MAELAATGFALIVIGAPLLVLWKLFREEYNEDKE
jgi:hypothetical protein